MLANRTFIGRYEIMAILGAGGMGEVYQARDSVLQRLVAIKILPANLVNDAQRVRRFELEAKSASALNHPGIVHIYDVGEATVQGATIRFIVMELVEGRSLRECMRIGASNCQFAAWLAQAADALAKAHDSGIVHRDLKPENLMVTNDGRIKVLDFGLAKLVDGFPIGPDSSTMPRVTRSGHIVGTPAYMSPEQVEQASVGPRSDIFSLGCILYEAVTARHPFRGNSVVDTMYRIVHSEPDPVDDPALDAIVRICLRKKAAERYGDCRALATALRQIESATPTTSTPTRKLLTLRRRMWLATIASLVFIGIVLGGALLLKSPQQKQQAHDGFADKRSASIVAPAAPPGNAAFSQQGSKLVGSHAIGYALQGASAALSADGNTVIAGGPGDDGGIGAAWIWRRNGAVWSQQGPKLVGAGYVGLSYQGTSVALSADGNTAVVGGSGDNGRLGAIWVWVWNGATWIQQGPKLVGSDSVGQSDQGVAVALSADGNTTIVGGWLDDDQIGAVWIWTRRGNVWTQQGPKLRPLGAFGHADYGYSVALSADGDTAVVGGHADDGTNGAVWVLGRNEETWTSRGPKLIASDAVGPAFQGVSVSLSADGDTALVGGRKHDNFIGAAWIWTRSKGGVWTPHRPKLVGSDFIGNSEQGFSVSLSGDGRTALVGGIDDNSGAGAAWVWKRRDALWTQHGAKLVGSGTVGNANQGKSVALSADGTTAAIGGYQDNDGMGALWIFTASGAQFE